LKSQYTRIAWRFSYTLIPSTTIHTYITQTDLLIKYSICISIKYNYKMHWH